MKKIFLILVILFLASPAFAGDGVYVNGSIQGVVGGAGTGDVTRIGNCLSGNCFVDGVVSPTLLFEGSTDDTSEITFGSLDATTDRTINLPDKDGTIAIIDPADTSTAGNCIEFDANGRLVDSGQPCNNPQGGNVSGAVSSTDNAITRFDGTGGATLQNSGVTIDDSANLATTGTVTAAGFVSSATGINTFSQGAEINSSGGSTANDDFIVNSDTLEMINLDASADAATVLGSWNYSGGKLELPNSTTLTSADCDDASEAGRIYIDTDASTGQQLYVCEGAAGWVLSSGAGGGGGGDNVAEGDSNIEVIDAGSGQIDIDLDGGLIARFNSSGNLGIGSASPDAKLVVNGNVKALGSGDPQMVFSPSISGDTVYHVCDDQDGGGDDNDFLRIGEGDTCGTNTFVSMDTNGNIGIGEESPAQSIEIKKDTGLDGSTASILNFHSTNNGTWTDEAKWAGIEFESDDTNGTAGKRAGIYAYQDATTGADVGLSFYTTTNGNTGYTEGLRIGHAGGVSIGTTSTTNNGVNISLKGDLGFYQYTKPSAPSVAVGAAGVLTGSYKYKAACYYFGSTGSHTDASAASGTVNPSSQQVNVTLPTCEGSANGWIVYRTLAGGSTYYQVASTTSSPYADNIADGTISSNAQAPAINRAGGVMKNASSSFMLSSGSSFGMGLNALTNNEAGIDNTVVGSDAGRYIKNGSYITAIGKDACRGDSTTQSLSGDYNTCVGRDSGEGLTTGDRNTLLGMGAGSAITTGSRNIAVGVDSYKDDAGSHNIAIGYHAGFSLTGNGSDNIIIGDIGADDITNGDNLIVIGASSNPADNLTNSGCIGYGCTVDEDNEFVIGGSTPYNVGIGTSNPIARLEVNGLIVPDKVTADPCSSGAPEGGIFYNDTSNVMCYCNGTDDVRMSDGTTACF